MITVIIPVYNTARWLPQCLDSVLGQDYRNIEVILVNDASTDRSPDICRRYAARDRRIVLIDKPQNEGQERARHSGLDVARGKYILHIDADDWLAHPQVLSYMRETAEETGADYVETGILRVLDRHRWFVQNCAVSELLVIEQPELFDRYYLAFFGVDLLAINMWGKLYRKSTLDRIEIAPAGVCMGEDLAYNMQLFPHLKKICILPDAGYNYRVGGMTCRYNPHLLPDLKRLYRMKSELIERYRYDKARNWIRIELKNVLRSAVCQQIVHNAGGGGRSAVIDYIAAEIADPLYAQLREVDASFGFAEDPFVQAVLRKDAETIYDLCLRRVRKERPRRLLRQAVCRILNWM